MKILVTGANGLLGQKLIQLLCSQPSVEIIATSRGKNRLAEPSLVRYESMDVTDLSQVKEIFQLHKPNVVIHTAAMTQVDECELNPDPCWQQNVGAVQNITEACKIFGAFLIHLSTDFIFDGLQGPYLEEATPQPLSHYGKTKLEAERIIQNKLKNWAIVRTVLVYGITPQMSRSNIILWVKKSLEEAKSIQVVDDQWRTPTLAEDLALGCWLIAKNNAQGVFNISGEELLTPYQIALKTAAYFNLDASLIQKADSSTFKQPALRPPKTGFIIDKAKKVLGYKPHSFEEGLELLAQQIKESAIL